MTVDLTSWPALLFALIIFGFAPGACLRLVVLCFHRDDQRRRELLAELHIVPRLERPFWVLEQFEVALRDGIWPRIHWALTGRVIHRWRLVSGIKSHQRHPATFWIPSPDEKAQIQPGDLVKLYFDMRRGHWGERMWVEVIDVGNHKLVGRLRNDALAMPRLWFGRRLTFTRDHVIDIDTEADREFQCEYMCPDCAAKDGHDEDQRG